MDLLQKTDYISKVIEIQLKIPSITGLADTALSAVENKIPDVNSLVKKQIVKQKYQTLKLNILQQLITTNLTFNKFKGQLINLILQDL